MTYKTQSLDPKNYREISYSCPTCGTWTSVLIPLDEKPSSYFAYMIECKACLDRSFAPPKPWYVRTEMRKRIKALIIGAAVGSLVTIVLALLGVI